MILITHAVIGAAVTTKIQTYTLIFLTGVASHYLSDAIPHWHYRVPRVTVALREQSMKKTLTFSVRFVGEFVKIAIDCAMGFLVSFFFFPGNMLAVFFAVFGAILPDLLVGFSRFYPSRFLILHQRFHNRIHTRTRLDDRPLVGIGTQLAVIIFGILFFGVY